jgi:hypothetical protein
MLLSDDCLNSFSQIVVIQLLIYQLFNNIFNDISIYSHVHIHSLSPISRPIHCLESIKHKLLSAHNSSQPQQVPTLRASSRLLYAPPL